ncbi:MAG: hypothetical protein KDJ63_07495 [Nitratireductor sp.]|nr:hypothetical protein [Nitratireductor sp.]
MRGLAYRLTAYLVTGISVGIAAWLFLCLALSDGGFAYGAVAAIFLLLGVLSAYFLLRQPVFRAGSADMTISPGQILASDLTCITAGTVAGFFLVDGFSERLFGIKACVTDPLAADVIAVMFIPAAALLALFVTQTGGQRIRADENGLLIKGISGSVQVSWEDIVSMQPQRQHVLVGRVGFLIPRHLRTNIVVSLRNGGSARIFDPGSGAARNSLIARLHGAMPARKRSLLNDIEEEWE